jgi:transcriptional regulator with XRE-family HTH domain
LKVPDRVGDLGGYLKEQRESARLSLRQLASAAGVSNPYLSQIERGLRKPSAEVLQGIAKGLQISAEALFQRAGLLENAGGAEVEAAIHSDARLTSRQKRVLLDIYATFRAENSRSDEAQTQAEAAAEQDRAADLISEALTEPSTPAKRPAARRRTKKTAQAG